MSRVFEPSVWAYLAYVGEFCVRYFAIVGGLYWFFHVGFRNRWLRHRIQRAFPDRDSIRHEIAWSMTNTATTGLSTVLTYHLVHQGRTSMYFGIADQGVLWLVASVAVCVVGYDAWLYWQHRFLHTPGMFRTIHWVHHRAGNPTPFATFAMHPVETLMGNAYFVLFVIFVPIHPVALAAVGGFLFLHGTILHLGYELFPRWFATHPVLGCFNTSTYHNLHHSLVRSNFGAYLVVWDRLLGTDHPSYAETWNRVIAQRTTVPAPDGHAAA
ncbi:MAG TPA: sterol desaturase family protein [Candidatus Binatia bacterium]|nr:sterol desaturase family protein [Candidatus Binatia bacterium]